MLSEGRQALRENAFDLLILNINLPDGSGLELLRTYNITRRGVIRISS